MKWEIIKKQDQETAITYPGVPTPYFCFRIDKTSNQLNQSTPPQLDKLHLKNWIKSTNAKAQSGKKFENLRWSIMIICNVLRNR